MASTVALSALALSGCPGATSFTTPRTIAQRSVQVQTALEVVSTPSGRTGSVRSGSYVHLSPSVGLRYGVTDRLEFGGRLSAVACALTLDVKWNGVRTRGFDLALMPRFDNHGIVAFNSLGLTVPMAFNAHPAVRVVLAPRVAGLPGGPALGSQDVFVANTDPVGSRPGVPPSSFVLTGLGVGGSAGVSLGAGPLHG